MRTEADIPIPRKPLPKENDKRNRLPVYRSVTPISLAKQAGTDSQLFTFQCSHIERDQLGLWRPIRMPSTAAAHGSNAVPPVLPA